DGGGVSTAFVVNGIWVTWNFYFAAYVVHHSVKSKQLRADYRFAQRLPTRIRSIRDGVASGEPVPATTEDINAFGLSFRCTYRFETGDLLEIPLQLAAGTVVTQ